LFGVVVWLFDLRNCFSFLQVINKKTSFIAEEWLINPVQMLRRYLVQRQNQSVFIVL